MAQKAHKPTEDTRKLVLELTGFGAPQTYICGEIGISVPTLEKYYRTELDTGAAKANSNMAKSLYQMGINGNVTAAIFWQKTRAGWKDNITIQGDPEHPVIHKVERVIVDPKPRKK